MNALLVPPKRETSFERLVFVNKQNRKARKKEKRSRNKENNGPKMGKGGRLNPIKRQLGLSGEKFTS
jgi:hypothetical protein